MAVRQIRGIGSVGKGGGDGERRGLEVWEKEGVTGERRGLGVWGENEGVMGKGGDWEYGGERKG